MKTLTDYLKERAEQERSNAVHYQAKREEWVQSVARLVHQLQKWLEQADSEKILRVVAASYPKHEEGLGPYDVTGLTIILGDRKAVVFPLARNVVGYVEENGKAGVRAQGRVDLTDGERKYMLYRLVDEQGERWVIVDDEHYRVQPLDQTTFEAALLSLLE